MAFLVSEDGAYSPLDSSSQSLKAVMQNPESAQSVREELLDTTNISAATHYYPSSAGFSMDGYKDLTIQYGLTDADGALTFTVEAKNDDSADWIDITKAGYRLDDHTTGNTSLFALDLRAVVMTATHPECLELSGSLITTTEFLIRPR